MKCIIISPITNTTSQLGEKLKSIYNIVNLVELEKKYAYFNSIDFINRFGDWIHGEDDENFFKGRLNETGEPIILEDEYGNFYTIDKNYNKLPINNRRFEGLEKVGIKELTNFKYEITSQIAAYIFGKHIKNEDFSDINDVSFDLEKEVNNFFDFALSKITNENSKEKARQTYTFLKKYSKDFALELKDFFKEKNLEYKQEEDFNDNLLQEEKEELGLGVDLKPSFENNNKNNASAKTKLLLSFLPELKKINGKIVPVMGDFIPLPKLLSFNQVWYDLEKELIDIPKLIKGNIVIDPFSIMKEKIALLSLRKPYLKALLYKLDKLDESSKTQFVSAFYNNTILDFDTLEIDGKEKSRLYTRLNAAETSSKSNKILSDWGINFQDNFIVNKDGKDSINLDKFNKSLEKYKNFKNKFFEFRKAALNKKNDTKLLNTFIFNFKDVLKDFGLEPSNNALEYFLSDMGEKPTLTAESLLKNINKFIENFDFTVNKISKKPKSIIRKNIFINPFLELSETKQKVITDLAKAEAFFNQEISENTLLTINKILWKYSLSSHINDKINIWKKDNSDLKKIKQKSNTKNSVFASLLLNNPDKLETLKLKLTSTIQEKNKSAEGTDNTSTSEVDALNRDIFEVLGHKVYGGIPTYLTPTPADKSTAFKIAIDFFLDTGARVSDGNFILNSKVLDIFVDYFEDEYIKAIEAKNDIINNTDKNGNVNTENLIQYYHANKRGFVLEVRDREGNVLLQTNNSNEARDFKDNTEVKTNIVFAGNAFKNSIIPSMSFDNIKENHSDIPRGTFYKTTGEPVINTNKLTPTQRNLVKDKINSILQDRINDVIEQAKQVDIITQDGNNNNIDVKLWKNYKGNVLALFSDYVINSMIFQIEFSKLFSGDFAMHKDIIDYFKRIPGTYISGNSLRLGITPNDHLFNITVLDDVYMDSEYLDQMPDNIKGFYKGINQTDAQAYITPKRWRFLKERLGQWSDKHEDLFNRIMKYNFKTDSLTNKDIKLLSAQPIKGVYRSLIDGRSVYLKYSQVVLLPSLVEGSPLNNLYKKMVSQDIDEAIFNSGVKIGANIVKGVSNKSITEDKLKLSKIQLDNRYWKLQQDLPTKLYKDTLVGSQIQKNIFNNINFEDTYDDLTGLELYKELHQITSELSNVGIYEVITELGLGSDFVIKNYSNLTKAIVDQLIQQKADQNIINAVQKELTPYVLPQARTKILNTIFSMINKKAIKIKTNGGSLIQMSNFALNKNEANNNGIYWLKDPAELAEPRLVNNEVLPGQVFIPASFISEYIPDWQSKTKEELFGENGLVDPRVLNIIGYRIPNQGTSSNDALEVVGILPEFYGDTIISYAGITTKTGSDFDIDKMFIMTPNVKAIYDNNTKKSGFNFLKSNNRFTRQYLIDELVKEGYSRDVLNIKTTQDIRELFVEDILLNGQNNNINKVEYLATVKTGEKEKGLVSLDYVEYNSEKGPQFNNKKALQNRLIELYRKVLLGNSTYNDLMTPLDFPFLQNDIKQLYDLDNQQINDLEMLSPFYQIKIKYEFLAGKFGIGQVANQLVDHMRGQTAELELPFYLGWGNYRETENGKVTIFDKNMNGETLSESVEGLKAIPIDNSLSAILNAFVDIAKDPYITIANWNTFTTNMGLMLIRAGVHPYKVNAFLGQPIIKELARETFNREGKLRLSDKTSTNLIPELFEKYKNYLKELYIDKNLKGDALIKEEIKFDDLIKNILSDSYLKIDINGKKISNRIQYRKINELRRNIKDKEFQSSKEYYIEQLLALKEYERLSNISKEFRLSVSTSKFGESGAGINPIQLMISKNNMSKLSEEQLLRGFNTKFNNDITGLTFLGTYYNNSVVFLSNLIENNPKLFLTSDNYFRNIFNEIASETHINKDYLNDESMGKLLDESVYSAILSGFSYFKEESKKDLYNDLFSTLFKDIEKLKKASNNFLIKELELKKDGKFNFLGINGARNKPVEYNNKITSAWLDLNNSNKELSDRLVKYAYYQSGFKNNINAFFKYIPNEIFINNNLEEYISYVDKNKKEILDSENIKDQIYRHNWNNSVLVPKIINNDIAKVNKTRKSSEHHVILKSNSGRHTGINENGNFTFPPFITKDFYKQGIDEFGQTINEEKEKLLYKLVAYQEIEQNVYEPIYIKTYKLGYKSSKGQFHEYNIDSEVNNSIYSDNNISKETEEYKDKLFNYIRSKRPLYLLDEFSSLKLERDYTYIKDVEKFENNLDNTENNSNLEEDFNFYFTSTRREDLELKDETVKGYTIKTDQFPNVELFTYKTDDGWAVIDKKSQGRIPLKGNAGFAKLKSDVLEGTKEVILQNKDNPNIVKALNEAGFNFEIESNPLDC